MRSNVAIARPRLLKYRPFDSASFHGGLFPSVFPSLRGLQSPATCGLAGTLPERRGPPATSTRDSVCLLNLVGGKAVDSLRIVAGWMGSLLGNWPSYDPHNFSQIRPSDASQPSKLTAVTYHPTHSQTLPPANQVISTEDNNILLQKFYQRAEDKQLRTKRSAPDNLTPDHGCKQPRGSFDGCPS